MSWFTTKKAGEIARFPGGILVKIVSIDRGRVRLEFINPPSPAKPAMEEPLPPASPATSEKRP